MHPAESVEQRQRDRGAARETQARLLPSPAVRRLDTPDDAARELLEVFGAVSIVDVACAGGELVRALLRHGVDARGIDEAPTAAHAAAALAPGRFACGSLRQIPLIEGACAVAVVHCLHHLDESDLDAVLAELHRVCRDGVHAVVVAPGAARAGAVATVRDRAWWEGRFLAAGFRKHPSYQWLTPYSTLDDDRPELRMPFERLAPAAVARSPASPERGGHPVVGGQQVPTRAVAAERPIDALRETGRSADAHVARYQLAAFFVRRGDVVVDVACGMGSGTAVLAAESHARRVIGVDASAEAIEYARATSGTRDGVEFLRADDGTLAGLDDASVDLIVSFDLLQHDRDPSVLLAEFHRALRPAGRVVIAGPGRQGWRDLAGQLGEHFLVEAAYSQRDGDTARGERRRRLHRVPLADAHDTAADRWLALAMKSPFDTAGATFVETTYPTTAGGEPINITAFGRDYDNPWLVKAMIAIGMRAVEPTILDRLAARTLESARPDSADFGAALCVAAYRLLEGEASTAWRAIALLRRIDDYLAVAAENPTVERWQLSLSFVAAFLTMANGRLAEARELFRCCAGRDALAYSPLLGTKTVSALIWQGRLAAVLGDQHLARESWAQAVREAARLLHGSWSEIHGDVTDPVEFGLVEAAQVLQAAAQAGSALIVHEERRSRPGLAWRTTRRSATADSSRELAEQRRTIADRGQRIAALAERDAVREAVRDAEVAALRNELAASREDALTAHAELDRLQGQLAETQSWIESVVASKTFRLARLAGRAQCVLLPKGSRRDRLAWRGLRAIALLRAAPRAWRRRDEPVPDPAPAPIGPLASAAADPIAVPDLVSVVLPVYNQADLLAESIESVLRQSYPHLELIVVDDGSSDDVERVLLRYEPHPRVRIVRQPNQKLPKALSNGFEFARGEFWTWTSADNVMEEHHLERHVAFLRARRHVAMVYSDYYAIDDRGELLRHPSFRPHNRRRPDDPAIHLPRSCQQLNVVQDNFVGPCFMYRARVGRLIGEYDPQLGVEDYDYWMRINGPFSIAHLGTDELLYRYRVHDNSLNARAAELGIVAKAEALMRYEAERSREYARPWTVVADAGTLPRLPERSLAPHRPGLLDDDSRSGGERHLRVLTSATLATAPAGPGVRAVVFGEDLEAPYDCRQQLAEPDVIAFAPSRDVAARVALFTRQCHGEPIGPDLVRTAIAFGNNRAFYERTRDAKARARCRPEVFAGDHPLRVLVQTDAFVQGGLEQVVLDRLHVLRRRGIEVALLVLGAEGPDAERARAMGIEILRLPDHDRERAYQRLLRDRRVDVVDAHHSVFGAAIAADATIPFVQTIHNAYVWLGGAEIDAYRDADPHTAAYACVSGNAARYSDLRLDLDVERMVVMPNGVELRGLPEGAAREARESIRRELGVGRDDFLFLNVASLYPPKAQHIAVQALDRARRADPRIKVAFLGRDMDPDYAAAVRRAVAEQGLADFTSFLGYRADARRIDHAADALLMPSYWEGWSLAVAEAAAAGLPAVLADVGAASEQIAACGGELVPPPYGRVTALDAGTIGDWVHGVQEEFVDAIAAAMVRVANGEHAITRRPELLATFDRDVAFGLHADLLAWLRTGGAPAAWRSQAWRALCTHHAARPIGDAV